MLAYFNLQSICNQKVFQKVRESVKEFVSQTQAGFIRGRSCANKLWISRRVAERAIENVPVYCALIDYKGAFDSLNRTTLGRVLGLFLPPSMVRRVISLYFDAKAKVMVNNTIGPGFDLHRGVREGCPTELFYIRFIIYQLVIQSDV